MHTFTASNGTKFHYNSDFSGEITIDTPIRLKSFKAMGLPENQFLVDGDDLVEFVAFCYVQQKKIAQIEQMTTDQLLGITS